MGTAFRSALGPLAPLAPKRAAWFVSLAAAIGCLLPGRASAELVFQPLFEFFNTNGGGGWPYGAMVRGLDGSLYGTTSSGGTNWRGYALGYGTVFRRSPGGAVSRVFSFELENGAYPTGPLIPAGDGSFYGATSAGGTNDHFNGGTCFRVTTNGVLTMMVQFGHSIGSQLSSGLCQASNGLMYGTTRYGGAYDAGTVFSLSTNGQLTVIASFDGTNGGGSSGPLVPTPDGNLVGISPESIYKVSPSGNITNLVLFYGTNFGGVMLAADGNCYGVTSRGGAYGRGTIFRLTPTDEFTTLFSFDGTNGSSPWRSLFQARDGYFYGSTSFRLVNGLSMTGTIFRFHTNGEFSTLVTMDRPDARNPGVYWTQDDDGNLYGVMTDANKVRAADGNSGMIFRLVERPVITSLTSAEAGVTLTWTSFSNAIYRVEASDQPTGGVVATLATAVPSQGATTSFVDPTAGASQRFYRVFLRP